MARVRVRSGGEKQVAPGKPGPTYFSHSMISRRPSSESVSGVERAGHGTIQGVEQQESSQTKSGAPGVASHKHHINMAAPKIDEEAAKQTTKVMDDKLERLLHTGLQLVANILLCLEDAMFVGFQKRDLVMPWWTRDIYIHSNTIY